MSEKIEKQLARIASFLERIAEAIEETNAIECDDKGDQER